MNNHLQYQTEPADWGSLQGELATGIAVGCLCYSFAATCSGQDWHHI